MRDVIEKAMKLLRNFVICDRCLGRQFAQLLTGTSNKKRGEALRFLLAMLVDATGDFHGMKKENFSGFRFRNKKLKGEKIERKRCEICNGVFEKVDSIARKIAKRLAKYEFKSFLIGTRLTAKLERMEEAVWELIGIEHCEPLKSELNREIGKKVRESLREMGIKYTRVKQKNPDILCIVDLIENEIKLQIAPLYVKGEYCKLVRGIPQTKWRRKIFRTSVQEIIEKPLLKATRGEKSRFHGAGREDISARCLGWRPFVIEIVKPRIRSIDLKQIEKEINKSKFVKVRRLKLASSEDVVKVKEARHLKTYRLLVKCEKKVDKKLLRRLKELETVIEQRTPLRVLRRRSDRIRRRKVYKVKTKLISPQKFELFVTCDAGLYARELVTGDEGRTKPSVASILNCKCDVLELDVIKVHKKEKT